MKIPSSLMPGQKITFKTKIALNTFGSAMIYTLTLNEQRRPNISFTMVSKGKPRDFERPH